MNGRVATLVAVGVLVGALVVTGVVVLVTSLSGSDDTTTQAGPDFIDNEALQPFYDQELQWEDCGANECADVTVPVNYEDPEGETLELAVSRIPGDDGADRALFVNPGGPGGSGIDYAPIVASRLSPDLRAEYDVIGFDPRGVQRSEPVVCLSDEDFIDFLAESGLVEDLADLEEDVATMREFGEGCVENAGELASFVSTQDVAHDLDVLRVLLDQEKLDYYGASYGTHIGATYADLYPQNAGRMVLDAAVQLEPDQLEQNLAQTESFQTAFDAFAAWCLADDCPLGDSAEEIAENVSEFIDGLADGPADIGTDRPLTQTEAFYGMIAPLYQEAAWPRMRSSLDAAINDGDGRDLQALADLYIGRTGDTFADNSFQVIRVVRCLDRVDQIPLEEQLDLLPQFEAISPLFGKYMVWDTTCQEWPVESPHEPLDYRAEGADPIVVIGTTRDPATPYEWSVEMAETLESGVLVSRDGDGHAAWGAGSRCVDEAVETFLLTGEPPEDGLECN